MKRVVLLVTLAGCSHHAKSDMGGAPDLLEVPDMALAPFARTIVQKPLMPTAPTNLLRDPFITGGTSFGQFRAYFENGAAIPLSRTLDSVSPVGGAASIGVLRDVPTTGGTAVRVTASFLGGSGMFTSSVWLSAGDAQANPIPFSQAAASLDVSLLGNDGMSKLALTPVSSDAVTYGKREWIQLQTVGGVELPMGGWLSIVTNDITLTLQIAAPSVLSSAITTGSKHHIVGHVTTMTDRDRAAIAEAGRLDTQHSRAP